MMFLIGFAITAAYIYSAVVLVWRVWIFLGTVFSTNPDHAFGTLDRNEINCRGIKELELLVQLMPADAHMLMPDMVHDVN